MNCGSCQSALNASHGRTFDKAQEAIELYPAYPDFKKRVLEAAKKELMPKPTSRLNMKNRHGRPVTAISFRVFAITRAGMLPNDEQLNLAYPLNPYGFGFAGNPASFVLDHTAPKAVRATIEAAEKQHGFDYVKRNILYSNGYASKNYAGYLAGVGYRLRA